MAFAAPGTVPAAGRQSWRFRGPPSGGWATPLL